MDHLMNEVDFPVEILGVIILVELLVRRTHGKSRQVYLVNFGGVFDIKESPEPFLA
jgi:hypothetical protein